MEKAAKSKEPIKLAHINPFGRITKWINYYCPNCRTQLIKNGNCPNCEMLIKWRK